MTDSERAGGDSQDLEDKPWVEDGAITGFDADSVVVIKTPSRTWKGTPEEFLELREALNEMDFIDALE